MKKVLFNYRLFVWFLLIMAIVMGGGYLIIAYTYKIQKETEFDIDLATKSILITKDIEIELVGLQNFTLVYLAEKSPRWLDSVAKRQKGFIMHLEKARNSINSGEEATLIQQISALFSNYEQNINKIKQLEKRGEWNKANALLLHSGKDLLPTVRDKIVQFIKLNQRSGEKQKKAIEQTNELIFGVMISLGIIGVLAGLFVGWIISRMLFAPISQLILTVQGASGEAVVEKLKIPSGDEISELGTRIQGLIDRVNSTQADLKKNQQLLQYSNKYAALGRIAPTIAHEIRNPLTSIKMLIYSMNDEPQFPESMKQDFEIISGEIDRMEEFIKNFLKFSKPAEPVFKTVRIDILLNEIVQLLKPQMRKQGVELKTELQSVEKEINADPGQMKQLFMNLILNALEAMMNGGELTLAITMVKRTVDPYKKTEIDYVCVSIEDTGPGIPPKVLKNLFEPFVRGSEQGVGLGLSISQNIATMHHGWIEGANKSDPTGAVFNVYIPAIHQNQST